MGGQGRQKTREAKDLLIKTQNREMITEKCFMDNKSWKSQMDKLNSLKRENHPLMSILTIYESRNFQDHYQM